MGRPELQGFAVFLVWGLGFWVGFRVSGFRGSGVLGYWV